MSMYDAIMGFPGQFSYEPKIENALPLGKHERFVVLGMGGSHLAADIVKAWKPELEIVIHHDYGLPALGVSAWATTLVIASSYSGDTEEVLDGFKEAQTKNLALLAVSVGGGLQELARASSVPYIQLPDTGIQPRSALGYSFKALLKAMGEEKALQEVNSLSAALDASDYEDLGKELAHTLKGLVPVIYTSRRNAAIGYNWKIKLNETGKIPAFFNTFPELNHNEMSSFDVKESTKNLSEKFFFLLLKDREDHPQIRKRMEMLLKLYRERGLRVEGVAIEGESRLVRIFSSLLLADWFAYFTAEQYGLEAEQVPMVEEFKKLLKQ